MYLHYKNVVKGFKLTPTSKNVWFQEEKKFSFFSYSRYDFLHLQISQGRHNCGHFPKWKQSIDLQRLFLRILAITRCKGEKQTVLSGTDKKEKMQLNEYTGTPHLSFQHPQCLT